MNDNNTELLIDAFANALEIEKNMVNDHLEYQGIPQWDSITHMILISEIENTFHIEIDADDVLEMNSFQKTKEILSKYNL
ncbi:MULTISPECIES: acyl carrier protein [Flagellimonas]|uniref:Acyl carrier protein n=1 Tax=Flagellimonas hadalis TaxID=2597517 RepID=A0A5N5ISI4_9FLAO|nr:acyl carrier protein [Allomuricauda hadalis]KAB5491501.1 acyl carrier protein [Allomuricauda hadalis]RUA12045.1 MAG: acyl carrier protein [Flavobacteriia bacterium]